MHQNYSAVVRSLVFTTVFVLLLWVFVTFPIGLMRGLTGPWVLLLATLLLVWLFRRLGYRQSVGSLGFAVAGWIEITGTKTWSAGSLIPVILFIVGTNLATAITEETVMRGYVLQNLEKGLGTTWAVILSQRFAPPGVRRCSQHCGLLTGDAR